jgi:hypothetical protein
VSLIFKPVCRLRADPTARDARVPLVLPFIKAKTVFQPFITSILASRAAYDALTMTNSKPSSCHSLGTYSIVRETQGTNEKIERTSKRLACTDRQLSILADLFDRYSNEPEALDLGSVLRLFQENDNNFGEDRGKEPGPTSCVMKPEGKSEIEDFCRTQPATDNIPTQGCTTEARPSPDSVFGRDRLVEQTDQIIETQTAQAKTVNYDSQNDIDTTKSTQDVTIRPCQACTTLSCTTRYVPQQAPQPERIIYCSECVLSVTYQASSLYNSSAWNVDCRVARADQSESRGIISNVLLDTGAQISLMNVTKAERLGCSM